MEMWSLESVQVLRFRMVQVQVGWFVRNRPVGCNYYCLLIVLLLTTIRSLVPAPVRVCAARFQLLAPKQSPDPRLPGRIHAQRLHAAGGGARYP